MNKSNLAAEYENDSVTGVAEHGIILQTDRGAIITGNVKWKWSKHEKIFPPDDVSLTENSRNPPPGLLYVPSLLHFHLHLSLVIQ